MSSWSAIISAPIRTLPASILRVAALVQSDDGADAQMSAIRAIDDAWDKWLTEYLANHRCG